MADVVIIVPVYKPMLDISEQIALSQVYRVLLKYPICLIAPQSLEKIDNYVFAGRYVSIEHFPNNFFRDRNSYSRLLLSVEFYERFQTYDFMLVYQLDAFVFSDQLEKFCKMDFDYIGAPWPRWFSSWHIGLKNCVVGNGGFSLRKISSVLRVLKKKEKIFSNKELCKKFCESEDVFFSYCGNQPDLEFHLADTKTARQFSIEWDYAHCYRKIPIELPFGCHGWSRFNFDVWKTSVMSQGYDIDLPSAKMVYKSWRWEADAKYLMKRLLRCVDQQRLRHIVMEQLAQKKSYAIWGMGEIGKRCATLFFLCGLSIFHFYDKNGPLKVYIHGRVIDVRKPGDDISKEDFIIVASHKSKQEIFDYLKKTGRAIHRDFCSYHEFEQCVFRKYYGK